MLLMRISEGAQREYLMSPDRVKVLNFLIDFFF